MDANTKEVLIAILTLVISPLILWFIARRNSKEIKAISLQVVEQKEKLLEKVDVVEKKLDENHKQANGHFSELLESAKQLATAKEKEKGDAALNIEKEKKK